MPGNVPNLYTVNILEKQIKPSNFVCWFYLHFKNCSVLSQSNLVIPLSHKIFSGLAAVIKDNLYRSPIITSQAFQKCGSTRSISSKPLAYNHRTHDAVQFQPLPKQATITMFADSDGVMSCFLPSSSTNSQVSLIFFLVSHYLNNPSIFSEQLKSTHSQKQPNTTQRCH